MEQAQPPPAQEPHPPIPAKEPISPSSPVVTAANREMIFCAGWPQRGQSAPGAPIDWSLSNRWSQVAQAYS